jgi:hypothetical protein
MGNKVREKSHTQLAFLNLGLPYCGLLAGCCSALEADARTREFFADLPLGPASETLADRFRVAGSSFFS